MFSESKQCVSFLRQFGVKRSPSYVVRPHLPLFFKCDYRLRRTFRTKNNRRYILIGHAPRGQKQKSHRLISTLRFLYHNPSNQHIHNSRLYSDDHPSPLFCFCPTSWALPPCYSQASPFLAVPTAS